MTETTDTQPAPQAKKRSLLARGTVLLLKAGLPLAVLLLTVGAFRTMTATAPQASRKALERQARLVEITLAEALHEQIEVEARGVVMPALDVVLTPQVQGEVISMSENLVPGGRFQAGEVLLHIDPRDYEFAVKQRDSELTRAKASLTLEQGNQDVVLHEYEVLGQELNEADKALVFRQPQLETAQGDLRAAEAMLRDAELDLERATVSAPFDALVTSENVDLGSRLTTQSTIARLVGTDTYWVELSIPQSDLRWVILPAEDAPGSRVLLRHPKVWGMEAFREAHVIRLLPDLSEQGRMARLLVAVDDPLGLKPENADAPKLLIGQYLEADIFGRDLDGVVRVARDYLHDGDQVWVMNGEGQLEVRNLEIVYRGRDEVIVASGIAVGERIVVTDLATGTEGMPLRTADETPPAPKSAGDPS